MNDTLKIIEERRSVRKYKDQPVDKKLIDQLLEAARMAPTGHNKQLWKFYVLTHREDIKMFSRQLIEVSGFKLPPEELKKFKDGDFIFYSAPLVIFITSPKDNEWAGVETGICAQNMMLAAKALGLDTCAIGMVKFIDKINAYSKLHVDKADEVQLALIFGYRDETPGVKELKRDNAFFVG